MEDSIEHSDRTGSEASGLHDHCVHSIVEE